MTSDSMLRIVILREGDGWATQCLDYDIGAQADDLDTLRERLIAVINAERVESERRTGEPFGGIDPAPQYYHDIWERQAVHYTPTLAKMKEAGEGFEFQLALCA